MTTIAYKHGVLCADTQITNKGVVCGRCTKVVLLEDGRVAAASGGLFEVKQFFNWLSGLCSQPSFESELAGIVIDNNLVAVEFDKTLIGVTLEVPYWVGGSGGMLALASLETGVSTRRAVIVACKLDIYSSEPLDAVYYDYAQKCWSRDEVT